MKQLRYWSFLPAFCLLALPLFGQNSLQLGSAVAEFGEDAEISITVDSESEVQGVVAVVEISGGGTAKDLVVGEVLNGANFIQTRVEDSYVMLGVVLDTDGMGGEVVPPGTNEVGRVVIQAGSTRGVFDVAFAADGVLDSVVVDSWEDPEVDGTFTWIRKETLSFEGCNPGDAGANPPIDPNTLCAFRNHASIPGGDWPSYDSSGSSVTWVGPDCFFEVGLNVGKLLGITDPTYSLTSVRLRTPRDLAFGHFTGEN